MAIIRVIHKATLKEHANELSQVADTYRASILDVNRSIEIRTENQKADAIEAFENKVNQLASTVFEQYPTLIKDYSQAINDYATKLETIGFTDDSLRSQKTPIENIAKWLTETTYNDFSDLKDDLDKQLKAASEALALEPYSTDETPPTLDTTLSDAQSELKALGENRKNTHNSLESALNSLKSRLDTIQAGLENVKNAMIQAEFMVNLPADQVVDLISKGELNTENMNELDAIMDSGDAAAFVAMHSDQRFENLGKIDPDHVSDAMMTLIYKLFMKEVQLAEEGGEDGQKHLDNMETFILQLNGQPVQSNKVYMEKLVLAGDRLGFTMLVEGVGLMPDLPDNPTVEDLAQYSAQLAEASPSLKQINVQLQRAAGLTALFESVYVLEIGQDTKSVTRMKGPYVAGGSTTRESTTISVEKVIKEGSIKLNGGKINFQSEHYEDGKLLKTYNADVLHYENADDIKNKELVAARSQLQEKRELAKLEFAKDLSKAVISFVPYGSVINTTLDVAEELYKFGDKPSFQGVNTINGKIPSDSGLKLEGNKGKILKTIDWVEKDLEKFNRTDEEYNKISKTLHSGLFDIGGIAIESAEADASDSTINVAGTTKQHVVRYTPQYDLQAAIEMYDLEQNGLRGYIYRNAVEEAKQNGLPDLEVVNAAKEKLGQFQDVITNFEITGDYTSSMKQLLVGTGERNLSIELVDPDKNKVTDEKTKIITLDQFLGGLKSVTGEVDANSDLKKQLFSYTGSSPSDFTNKLSSHYGKLVGN